MNVPASVTRKNLVSFYCQFYQPATPTFPPTVPAPASTIVNPTSASVVLNYTGTNGLSQTTTIPMTLNSQTSIWSASWDSSNSIGAESEGMPAGQVDWLIYASGSAQAAQQGTFYVVANNANTI